MAQKRMLEKISETDYVLKIKNEKVAETIREYAWNSPRGFLHFGKLALLTEISAPSIILLNEMRQMVTHMTGASIARNEIARMKTVLFEAYPNLKKQIAKARFGSSQ